MELLAQLRENGYRVSLHGTDILLSYAGESEPDPAIINPLLQKLKARKAEALAFLRLEAETRKALAQLEQYGFIKVWSTKIQKTVYFLRTDKEMVKIPLGEVFFTFDELRELTARQASPEELLKLYNDRKL